MLLFAAGQADAADVSTVRIPGTTVEVELVRCPGNDAAGIPDLWVCRTEVTWDLYDVFLYRLDLPEGDADADAASRPSKPYVPPDRGFGRHGFAAIGMTRHAAEQFCAWIEAKTGLPARLPTREEFVDLAARGGGLLAEAVWCNAVSGNRPRRADEGPANAAGLLGMQGNVAEWVKTDGKPAIAMGGSYRDDAAACTPDAEQRQASSWNASDPQIPKSRWWLADCSWVGFRFVIEAGKAPGMTADEDGERDHGEP